jgi:hypothetical protein
MDQSNLSEDRKKYRKLRKLLRQIEQLTLKARELNDEEKLKISKRKECRRELKALVEKYGESIDMLQEDERDEQHHASTDHVEQVINESETEEPEQSGHEAEAVTVHQQHEESDFVQSEQVDVSKEQEEPVTQQFDDEKKTEPEVSAAVVVDQNVQKPPQAKSSKSKAKSAKQPAVVAVKIEQPKPPKFKFDTWCKLDAHRELVVCVDVCPETGFIATGRFDL